MHSAIKNMHARYSCTTLDDHKNALVEIIQEIALSGLYRAGFFSHAAFYGGTALRIFYKLDRFSEDLDFSLLQPDPTFTLKEYAQSVKNELGAYGLEMSVDEKTKAHETAIRSAFIKGDTLIHLIKIKAADPSILPSGNQELLKIKLEVDTNPPPAAEFEVKYILTPTPFSVRLYTPSSLFAGKVHALLCRSWKTRVKGRDFYDYVWYLSQSIPVNLNHLAQRMIQTGHLASGELLTVELLKKKLIDRFNNVDFEQAKHDITPFIKNTGTLEIWSADFFSTITKDSLTVIHQNKQAQ